MADVAFRPSKVCYGNALGRERFELEVQKQRFDGVSGAAVRSNAGEVEVLNLERRLQHFFQQLSEPIG